jgi:hypothetical protein
MQKARIVIDGQDVPPGAAWSLRWVDREGGPPEAALYRDGRRLTSPWRLEVQIDHPGDPYGGNANTD